MNLQETIDMLERYLKGNPDQRDVDVLENGVLPELINQAKPLGVILWTRDDLREHVADGDIPEGADYEEIITAIAARVSEDLLADCSAGSEYLQDICEEYLEEIKQN